MEEKETNVKATIDAVTGLVKAVPIYQDAVQPAAKQIGKSLETVSKTVNIALAPIKALVWGYEKIEDFISSRVAEKLKNVAEENIITPPPEIAGPAIESLRFSGHDPNLRELYANLLATAMDKETVHKAHPGFVETLKNLTSDEALLLQTFTTQSSHPLIDIRGKAIEGKGFAEFYSNYGHFHKKVKFNRPNLVPAYIDNLCRLGIVEIPALTAMTAPNTYEPLINDPDLDQIKFDIENNLKRKLDFQNKIVKLTQFGKQFVENVVIEKK
jgi:hypothetical protein